jgi:ABC-type polysaccharide/polyol phosphate export permease
MAQPALYAGAAMQTTPTEPSSQAMTLHVAWNLVAQQLAMRYRRAWLGATWMLVAPLITMAVMSVALTLVFDIKGPKLIAHILVSFLPFMLFQNTVNSASASLIAHQELIRRHNIKRHVFPISAVMLCVIEYIVASISLLILGWMLDLQVGWEMVTVVLGFLCICVMATGLGLLGAVATVHFRDLSQLIAVGLGLLYWMTPVIYMLSMMPEAYQKYFYINPLVSMLAMYTEPLLEGRFPPAHCFVIAIASAAVSLAVGAWVFKRKAGQVVYHL